VVIPRPFIGQPAAEVIVPILPNQVGQRLRFLHRLKAQQQATQSFSIALLESGCAGNLAHRNDVGAIHDMHYDIAGSAGLDYRPNLCLVFALKREAQVGSLLLLCVIRGLAPEYVDMVELTVNLRHLHDNRGGSLQGLSANNRIPNERAAQGRKERLNADGHMLLRA